MTSSTMSLSVVADKVTAPASMQAAYGNQMDSRKRYLCGQSGRNPTLLNMAENHQLN